MKLNKSRRNEKKGNVRSSMQLECLESRELMAADFYPAQGATSASVTGDFNGDGYADIAVGQIDQNGGHVKVHYGSENGVSPYGWISRGENTGPNDRFGASLAVGDFNGDGVDDLAIGAPGRKLFSWAGLPFFAENAGAVEVFYGSSWGLMPEASMVLTQSSFLASSIGSGDQFGFSIAAGDFDNDGYEDLAIGVPGEDLHPFARNVGEVEIIYGSQSGLSDVRHKRLTQSSISRSVSQNGDLFGYSLAVGDFNGDGFDDLAIGVPKEDVLNNTRKDAGAVDIVYGSNDGLTLAYQNRWSLIQSNISNGHSESGELFGSVLVAGDFDGDGFDDLAIGTPFDENKYGGNQGNIDVVYGSNWGITAWSGGATLTPEESIGDTGWGFVIEMAVGDFNNDGIEDLVVGSPGVHGYRGAVDFVFGNSARELMKGPRLIQAESSRLFGSQFGTNVVVGDFNGDGYVDMAATSFVGTYDDLFNFMSPDFVDIYFSDERGLNVRLDQRLEI